MVVSCGADAARDDGSALGEPSHGATTLIQTITVTMRNFEKWWRNMGSTHELAMWMCWSCLRACRNQTARGGFSFDFIMS